MLWFPLIGFYITSTTTNVIIQSNTQTMFTKSSSLYNPLRNEPNSNEIKRRLGNQVAQVCLPKHSLLFGAYFLQGTVFVIRGCREL